MDDIHKNKINETDLLNAITVLKSMRNGDVALKQKEKDKYHTMTMYS
jgi:hypothetical protein